MMRAPYALSIVLSMLSPPAGPLSPVAVSLSQKSQQVLIASPEQQECQREEVSRGLVPLLEEHGCRRCLPYHGHE